MTVDRTFRPRAWATAAAAAFVSGLATTGVAFTPGGLAQIEPLVSEHRPPGSVASAAPSERSDPSGGSAVVGSAPDASAAEATLSMQGLRVAGPIALRPDPANPNLLVVDFAVDRSAGRVGGAPPGAISAGRATAPR